MNPELEQRLEQMERRIKMLENVTDPETIEKIDSQLILNESTVTSANILDTYTTAASDTVDALAIPDGFFIRRYKNTPRLVPYYNFSKK
jgi:hypothetical protein